MSQDRERVGRLVPREEDAHAAAERATHERDPFVAFRAKGLASDPKVGELSLIPRAGSRAASRERHRAAHDPALGERGRELSQDRLPLRSAVARREHSGAAAHVDFGSFCARLSDGASRSPTCSSRTDMFIIVNASGRPSEAISSHRSGADTGARRIGRTLYGPAVDFARVFCR